MMKKDGYKNNHFYREKYLILDHPGIIIHKLLYEKIMRFLAFGLHSKLIKISLDIFSPAVWPNTIKS